MTQVCSFKMVRVHIPQKKLRRLYESEQFISMDDDLKISRKLAEIKGAMAKLLHTQSVVEKILLRSPKRERISQ